MTIKAPQKALWNYEASLRDYIPYHWRSFITGHHAAHSPEARSRIPLDNATALQAVLINSRNAKRRAFHVRGARITRDPFARFQDDDDDDDDDDKANYVIM